ncbi:hypothetical protein PIB30_058479 [Stylosanthes scabra]|uniref:Uncharacterized protein n=1 Tax=Stylosanthes scabra TaxID=79078 RepID=A0ABU6ZIS0_9FABA|nr:hypothetical protein [Stylosanthes scabra]
MGKNNEPADVGFTPKSGLNLSRGCDIKNLRLNTRPPPPNPTPLSLSPLPPPLPPIPLPPPPSLSFSLLASITSENHQCSQRAPRSMSSRGPNGAASARATAVTTPARNRMGATMATLAGYIESFVTKRKRGRKAGGAKRTEGEAGNKFGRRKRSGGRFGQWW